MIFVFRHICVGRKDEWTMQEVAKLKATNEALEQELKELTSDEVRCSLFIYFAAFFL